MHHDDGFVSVRLARPWRGLRGFTLIELLVVIAIIAILAALSGTPLQQLVPSSGNPDVFWLQDHATK